MEHHHCCQHHDHEGGCGCGHDHGHEGCGCGCGCHGHAVPDELTITRAEGELLSRFSQTPFMPLARFVMRSTREDELEAVGMPAVYLEVADAPMEQVRATAQSLERMEKLGLITLDYDIPLREYDYGAYESSALYASFRAMVEEGGGKPGFLFDQPILELGSMALTDLGQAVMEQVLGLLEQ